MKMARGVNKVILIGNIGGDPEVRYLANGSAVETITLATSESWKDKQTGHTQERTEWHRVVFFNRLGEIAGEFLRKGSKVYIEGQLRTNKCKDQEGKDRYRTEIIGNEMQMLDTRGNHGQAQQGSQGQGPQKQGGYQQQAPAPPRPASQSPHQSTPKAGDFNQNQQEIAEPNFDDFDDDIPFENPYKSREYLV